MPKPELVLLWVDAAINILLGILLLAFSRPLIHLVGVPHTDARFYPTILGAVLFGIGLALVIEASKRPHGFSGLGLGGAVAINLCGGSVLLLWLISGVLDLPLRGSVFLWTLAIILVGISIIELIAHYRPKPAA